MPSPPKTLGHCERPSEAYAFSRSKRRESHGLLFYAHPHFCAFFSLMHINVHQDAGKPWGLPTCATANNRPRLPKFAIGTRMESRPHLTIDESPGIHAALAQQCLRWPRTCANRLAANRGVCTCRSENQDRIVFAFAFALASAGCTVRSDRRWRWRWRWQKGEPDNPQPCPCQTHPLWGQQPRITEWNASREARKTKAVANH